MLDTTRRLISNTQHTRTDWIGPLVILALSIIGIFFIYSAQAFSGGTYWMKQMVWLALGSSVYIVLSRIDYKIYMENAFWFYAAAVLLLLLVLFSPLGLTREGAQRWLNFGIMAYQPSEGFHVRQSSATPSLI